ncbi:MAG: hypothetical protein B7733_15310 [Myxococcales bacterium FL481]|nr:MAG: hypothetical protein B7733_15310 [Myxococcales bacterium FL481]
MKIDLGGILDSVQRHLEQAGVAVDLSGAASQDAAADAKVKVVCVTPDLAEEAREMGNARREDAVTIRIDDATREALDAWVDAGVVESRREAAALFLREGLRTRAEELEKLRDALREVERARERLRDRAKDVLARDDD